MSFGINLTDMRPHAIVDGNGVVHGICMAMFGEKRVSQELAVRLSAGERLPDSVRLLPVPRKAFAGGPVGKGWTVREGDNGTLEYASPRDEETGTSTFRVLYREEKGVAVQMVSSWEDSENG